MSILRRDFVRLGCLLGIGLVGESRASDDPPPAKSARSPMDALWIDLEKDEEIATRALLKFADHPKEAVAYFAEAMKPLTIDADWVQVRLMRLGNKVDEEVWRGAIEELEYFDPRLAIDLEKLMTDVTDSPARQRMVEVLSGRQPEQLKGKPITLRKVGEDGFNFFDGRGSWWAEHRVDRLMSRDGDSYKKKWTRAIRAMALLEHIGSPEATAVLKAMATGHMDARPTKSAKEALARLAAKTR
jgi:hypothetical protein